MDDYTRAISRIQLKIEALQHEKLIVIALRRCQKGNEGMFEFSFGSRSRYYLAYIKENKAMKSGKILYIDYYKDGAPYCSIPVVLAEERRDSYREKVQS